MRIGRVENTTAVDQASARSLSIRVHVQMIELKVWRTADALCKERDNVGGHRASGISAVTGPATVPDEIEVRTIEHQWATVVGHPAIRICVRLRTAAGKTLRRHRKRRHRYQCDCNDYVFHMNFSSRSL